MLLQFLLVLQLSYTNFSLAIDDYETVFASNACFSAKDYTQSTIFKAPKNGTLYGIKLQHLNGSVTCDSMFPQTKWGCDIFFLTFFLRLIENTTDYYGQLLYPTNNTQDVIVQPLNNTDNIDFSSCLRGCIYNRYEMFNYDASSTNYSLISPAYNVSTNDRFMLQYSEACCFDLLLPYNNSGSTCAAIQFIYINSMSGTTSEPSIEATPSPTIQPTNEPTNEPTIEPSTEPTEEPTIYPTQSPTDTYYFVIVQVTYNGTNTTSNVVQLLSNITKYALIGNLNINVSNCIIDIHTNITHKTVISITIENIIMTCLDETSKILAAYYDKYLENALFNNINGIANSIHWVMDIINNAEAEVVESTQFIVNTMEIEVSSNNESSDNDAKNRNILFDIFHVFIWMAILLVCVIVFCTIIYQKRKHMKIKHGHLQMGLLSGEQSISTKKSKSHNRRKHHKVIEGDNHFYTPAFKGMLSTESESMYKVINDNDIITKGNTTKGDSVELQPDDAEAMYDPPEINRTTSTATSQGVYSEGIQTHKKHFNINDDYKQTYHVENHNDEIDTDGFIGDDNNNENNSSNDYLENISTIQ
eukprot:489494_1